MRQDETGDKISTIINVLTILKGVKMTINFGIMILYKEDAPNVNEDIFIEDVIITTNAQISDVIKANPVKSDIMKKLLFACNKNKNDAILIIGNIEPAERHIVTEAIKNVIDNKEKLSEYMANSILNIETRLNEIMPHKTLCGVQNQILIVDLSGPYKNPEVCFKAVVDMILETIYWLGDLMDKENISSNNVASTSDYKSTKQKDASTAVKRPKTSIPLPDSMIMSSTKRHKNSHSMISLKEAVFKMNEVIKNLGKGSREMAFETVPLSDAYGRIMYEKDIKSICNVPPFKASTKHGYAVLATDGKGLRKVLDVNDTMSLQSGTCLWVKSGAPIPDGATAVVPVKDTKLVEKSENSDDTYIEIMVEPRKEQNIKPTGYDLKKGKVLRIPQFTHIGPMEIGLLAASGRKEVQVFKYIPSIGVLSIGNYLKEPGELLTPGFMYDVNRISLTALLKEQGFDSLDFGIVENKMLPIRGKIDEALKKVDILVTTGSSNDRDLMKTILEKYYEATIHFGNVNIKPGKSTIFATCKIDDAVKYFLCFPGNPVSARIVAQIFLVTLVNDLRHNLSGDYNVVVHPIKMKHQYVLHNRPRIAWAILEWDVEEAHAMAYSKGNIISDKLITAVGANALLLLPEKETGGLSESNTRALLVKFPKRFNEKNYLNLSEDNETNKPKVVIKRKKSI
ncbi:gephyrin [Monomorium pharaonis]|uniref:gephyrin n=1 Tax=Monomorium pharaonis TaxID=307658 RepID=UPI001747A258|nr:gephyrin [Monomorium pharaonis]XP_036149577.1 gephyrin [Monomorium pharaonis]